MFTDSKKGEFFNLTLLEEFENTFTSLHHNDFSHASLPCNYESLKMAETLLNTNLDCQPTFIKIFLIYKSTPVNNLIKVSI